MKDQTILICCGTGCRANGSMAVAEAFGQIIAEKNLSAEVQTDIKKTGCSGLCESGPVVQILPQGIMYYKVKVKDVPAIVERTLEGGEIIESLLGKDNDGKRVKTQQEHPFYANQQKIALKDLGWLDPESIDAYIEAGGYQALKKALTMTPEAIINEVEASNLRGRGGAGFPTGRKWRTAAGYDVFPKYVVCNGDEGDPGAFMDCSLMEGNPHVVLEGLAIAAIAIGAEEGFFYVRDEYDLAVRMLRGAIADAEDRGILGESVMGTDHKLKLSVVRGGGAFVCGESTALMASIAGRVGEPRAKYIRSVQRGLWDHPTVLNNVETLANIPVIIRDGGAAFAQVGTEKSGGTKVFAMVGKVKRTGLAEVPMGATLRHLIFDIGGGILGDRPFKAVQTGGPSGGCIPESMLDLEVDFDTLKAYGAMMGSGGMIVMDDRSCMVEVARYYTKFLCEESCGKCTPCREGLRRMLEILTDICEGRGREGDIELLETIGHAMEDASLCSLGKSAPNPVLTTIKFFREEYEAHIRDHYCPAGVCTKLVAFAIDKNVCVGCGACSRQCPVEAISGGKKAPHTIDPAKCIVCGSCREACHFDAVITVKKGAGHQKTASSLAVELL
ncbi:MAG: NADH-ubiquinone oxidoreductase-F iron-sulfur binding region domain-containing protein [Eubacterium aggregans]|uniref:NADH-ubiquinone oxidoreductase-F iron-sulfur binding region domain-containing protein n=1 Tax=Eubacterium aggregans TaxID=81409 RepID=UPI0023F44D9E|nr:NADH-ubiquinone oxidoreductase-F iron-sulfur binding region domain-containing protein [Eubacterium aggregans]MDD4691768.1 NADH-ubiquinone oxidoreductase-F iron-sulfur binding region domain-containing protein [Eubacterium aggregans]MEA5073717.1 NADH-ubiquinone oxidoreductase-F iron-sulfur binding region domain-containing protein [Eubacterium aggregans]